MNVSAPKLQTQLNNLKRCKCQQEGRVITWWSFSSCTTKLSVLENPAFLGKAGDRTIFQILTHRGIDNSPYSAVRSSPRRAHDECMID